MITVECKHCGKHTAKAVTRYNESIRNGWNFFCSRYCRYAFQEKGKEMACAQCGLPVRRTPAQIRQTKKNIFCSKACAAKYNNAHKAYGCRRSKLEEFIERRIREEFPEINLQCNTLDPLGIELDFYFPDFHLAIEVNGIFHYKPVYGQEKLQRVQANDEKKARLCEQERIDLHVIKVPGDVYPNQKLRQDYWVSVKELISSHIKLGGNK